MGYSSNHTHSNRLYLGMVRANEKQIKFISELKSNYFQKCGI